MCSDMCNVFAIQPKDGDTMTSLQCASADEKRTWVSSLKRIIKEYQIKEVAPSKR
jgi:hypothetical protein